MELLAPVLAWRGATLWEGNYVLEYSKTACYLSMCTVGIHIYNYRLPLHKAQLVSPWSTETTGTVSMLVASGEYIIPHTWFIAGSIQGFLWCSPPLACSQTGDLTPILSRHGSFLVHSLIKSVHVSHILSTSWKTSRHLSGVSM